MLKTAIPAEASPRMCLGENVTLAGEEVKGSATSLKNKTEEKSLVCCSPQGHRVEHD